MKSMKRFLSILLLAVLVALPMVSASAASTRYITSPNGGKVNLRHGPSDTTYAVAAQVSPGTQVTLLSSSKGWSTIRYNGYTLYVKSRYLTSDKNAASKSVHFGGTSSSGKVRYIASSNGKKINVYHGPNTTTYAVAAQLPSGTKVSVLSSSKGWAKIKYNGFVVYVQSKYVSSTSTKASSSGSSGSSSSTGSVRYIYSSDGKKVNLRHGPSTTGYAVAAQLTPGTKVTLLSASKGWAKVRYNGYTLYVMTKYLRK